MERKKRRKGDGAEEEATGEATHGTRFEGRNAAGGRAGEGRRDREGYASESEARWFAAYVQRPSV